MIETALNAQRRIGLVVAGAAHWRDPNSDVRRQAREALRDGAWSPQVVESALEAVLWELNSAKAEASALHARGRAVPTLVILPGNVIGPAIATAYCAALAGAPVTLKAASNERGLATIIARQFDELGPPLAGSLKAVWWRGGDAATEAEALKAVRRAIVFGEDATITDIGARAPADVVVIGYGESYSIAVVGAGADPAAAAAGAARDICVFDQRGCMSPQTIYVEGDAGRALMFGHALVAALLETGRALPRAKPQPGEAEMAADYVRRLRVNALSPRTHGLATTIVGPMVERCPEFVVAIESFGPPICAGFGRIACVKPCDSIAAVISAVQAYGRPLDTVGCASYPLDAHMNSRDYRTCALGEMQRPPFGYRPKVTDFLEPAT